MQPFSGRDTLLYNVRMSKNLVIVESPAKAKTIEKFLGGDFHVLSSQGHIRDIEGAGKNSIGIDFANGYTPHYAIDPKKEKLIEALKSAAKKADTVWLASDEDREGEAIAWHLQEVLQLPKESTRRIVFHEITKTAIQEAILKPRDIDYNLVDAQQARRVLDRIVGFELSPVLWKKIIPGLSAGRVQSVAVRLIVEREREIEQFASVAQYRVIADFMGKNTAGKTVKLRTELNHRFATEKEAFAFLDACKDDVFQIKAITKKPIKRSPAPPFTTSSLQQEAARKLHFTVSKTMRLAQSLYEAGHITYMRTDSFNLSSLALNTAKAEITNEFGDKYHKLRKFTTSAKGAQEAHEAIRPTYMSEHIAGANADERKLYELIWKRTLASQMADAEIENTRIEVAGTKSEYLFVANGEVILFDGFMKVYIQSTDEETEAAESKLPQINEGTAMQYKTITAQESFTKAPPRYTEASLVKRMEELGIGRPSTYATIIETIQSREYVVRGNKAGKERDMRILTLADNNITEQTKKETYGADSGKLVPTDLGCTTNDFLVASFPSILSYDFTADAETNFDKIAAGKANWVKTVDKFYHTFHPLIEQVPVGKIEGRLLGTEPATGKPVVAKIGKKGACIQIGTAADEEKPRFASLEKDQSIFTITLDEALALFDTPYPYTVGTYEEKELIVNVGMFGPYVKQGTTYYSIPKTIDPAHLTLSDAIMVIENKRIASLPILDFGDIQVLNGRYGAYIKYNGVNYKLPKGTVAQMLTEADCKDIIAKTEPTGKARKASRTTKKKK